MLDVGAEYFADLGSRTFHTVENMWFYAAVTMWAGLGLDVDYGAFCVGFDVFHILRNFIYEAGSVWWDYLS
jgi:hypothetical protein